MASFHCLTFLTDYGLEDGFVAACHGVSSQIAPNIRIIDITHLVPPGDIRRGATVLAQTVPYMPLAVHVAVVDPGVGTGRRGVAVAARNGSVFVGPDNGLLPWAAEAVGGPVRAVSLTNSELWLSDVTATFHGRDIFMPVAAHLAAGTPFDYAGTPLDVTELVTLPAPVSRVTGAAAEGEVLTVDRFGNVQLSVTRALAELAGLVPGVTVRVRWDGRELTVPFRRAFSEVAPGEVVAITDSSGRTAIAVNGGDAAARLGLRAGMPVTISVSKGQMLSQGGE
jgi:S-adenosyl-L-methionine hydrolase (adenosine-forming)